MNRRERDQWEAWYENRPAVSPRHLEPAPSHEPVGTEKISRLDSPCRIHVVSYRHRLADADGISAKAAIDGLIHAGILRDDSPEFVKEVSYSQVKVSGKEMERTEIQIEALPGPAKEVAAPAKGGGTLRPPAG